LVTLHFTAKSIPQRHGIHPFPADITKDLNQVFYKVLEERDILPLTQSCGTTNTKEKKLLSFKTKLYWATFMRSCTNGGIFTFNGNWKNMVIKINHEI